MLTAIALAPSAPVLLPELAGQAAVELADLRVAAIAAVAALPKQWTVIGVGPADETLTRLRGTFAGYGVDVPVALCPPPPPDFAALPLCALMAGWLREQGNPDASITVHVCAAGLGSEDSVNRGRALRTEIDRTAEPVGVLILADGANTLTPAAPGGYEPDSIVVQQALDDALEAADAAALTRLPSGVVGRVAYQVLAGLAGTDTWSATGMHCCAPYGVGYTAGLWERG
ncbi:MAG TPA: hypothetical protein PLK19_06135 [Mycobacterium sp.]|nr:hypothetical protein [Mycobacterium sp.]